MWVRIITEDWEWTERVKDDGVGEPQKNPNPEKTIPQVGGDIRSNVEVLSSGDEEGS